MGQRDRGHPMGVASRNRRSLAAALPDRKPPMLAAAVLANRMARIVRSVSTKKEPAGLPLSLGRRAAVETAGTDEEMKKGGFQSLASA